MESLQSDQQCQPGQTGTECSNVPLPSLRTPLIISIPNDKHEDEKRQDQFKNHPKPPLVENIHLNDIKKAEADD